MFGGGSQPTAQGYIKPVYGADFSIRKDFLKNNAASVTLQVSDIFRTRVYDTYAETNFFIQENSRRRDPQIVKCLISIGDLENSILHYSNERI